MAFLVAFVHAQCWFARGWTICAAHYIYSYAVIRTPDHTTPVWFCDAYHRNLILGIPCYLHPGSHYLTLHAWFTRSPLRSTFFVPPLYATVTLLPHCTSRCFLLQVPPPTFCFPPPSWLPFTFLPIWIVYTHYLPPFRICTHWIAIPVTPLPCTLRFTFHSPFSGSVTCFPFHTVPLFYITIHLHYTFIAIGCSCLQILFGLYSLLFNCYC